MSSDTMGASILALGIWIIFTLAILSGNPGQRHNEMWIATASEMIPSHPELVRAAPGRHRDGKSQRPSLAF